MEQVFTWYRTKDEMPTVPGRYLTCSLKGVVLVRDVKILTKDDGAQIVCWSGASDEKTLAYWAKIPPVPYIEEDLATEEKKRVLAEYEKMLATVENLQERLNKNAKRLEELEKMAREGET